MDDASDYDRNFDLADLPGVTVEGDFVTILHGSHVISRAWCVEMSAATDIDGAREFWLGQTRPRLKFLCPDDECRERAAPKITGTNYDVTPDDEHLIKMSPHFRWNPSDPHIIWCDLVVEFAARAANQMRRQAKSPDKKDGAPNGNDIVDVFDVPREAKSPDERDGEGGPPAERRDVARRVRARAATLRDGPVHSSALRRVVTCYEELFAEGAAGEAHLTIDGVTLPYLHWFRPMERFQDWHGRRIFFGGADVRRGKVGFFLSFKDEVTLDGTTARPYAFVSDEMLADGRNGRTLRAVLEAALTDEWDYVKCYLLGEMVVTDKGQLRVVFDTTGEVFMTLKKRRAREEA